MSPDPQIAVVVPSHNRALRLRWLLNSLEEQTLSRERFEVIVADDSDDGGENERLLQSHPGEGGAEPARRPGRHRAEPRALRFAPDPGTPTASKLRNAGWRAASAPLVVFT